ncbi:protein REVEILLE 1-like isoform X2 [Humulus lupulus]|uniref:protein REVEILLE 1-like isoform X2 n=1 Tax=Humulus lupulus TaxID=3486 RepID=UPI002B415D82|nr:protein REVEILLE 1-like isoform X2 [Humulus lupulus]
MAELGERSKIAQDPNGSNVNTEESIEIPPPRPKRKPMHPYPRKLAHSTKEELSIPEHSTKSYLSLSEQDNQSPKSVLSAMGSDTIGLSGSNTQDESLSPVSSSTGIHVGSILFSEPNSSTEDIGSPPAAVKASVSSPSQLPVKLELFSQDNACAKGTSAEIVSARSLTLFGTIVFVADSHRPSSPTMGTCKPLPSCEQEEKLAQPLPSPVTETESSTETAHCVWGHLPRAVQALYLMHFQNGFPNLVGSGSVTPMPLWPYYGGLPFPSNNQDQVKGSLDSNLSEVQEVNEEGSWSGSNTGSLNCDKCLDADSQSRYTSLEKEEKEVSILEWKPSSRSAFSQHKISSEKYKRGFVPYKRSRVETDRQSLTMKSQERQENRIQLCL